MQFRLYYLFLPSIFFLRHTKFRPNKNFAQQKFVPIFTHVPISTKTTESYIRNTHTCNTHISNTHISNTHTSNNPCEENNPYIICNLTIAQLIVAIITTNTTSITTTITTGITIFTLVVIVIWSLK